MPFVVWASALLLFCRLKAPLVQWVWCPEGGRSQYAGGGVTESTGLVLLGGGGGGGLTSLS